MGQLGFFDLNRRYESLTEKNDPLVAIAAMVPFESFRPKLHKTPAPAPNFVARSSVAPFKFAKKSNGAPWIMGTSKNMHFPPPRKSDSRYERGRVAWDSLASSI